MYLVLRSMILLLLLLLFAVDILVVMVFRVVRYMVGQRVWQAVPPLYEDSVRRYPVRCSPACALLCMVSSELFSHVPGSRCRYVLVYNSDPGPASELTGRQACEQSKHAKRPRGEGGVGPRGKRCCLLPCCAGAVCCLTAHQVPYRAASTRYDT